MNGRAINARVRATFRGAQVTPNFRLVVNRFIRLPGVHSVASVTLVMVAGKVKGRLTTVLTIPCFGKAQCISI